MLKIEDNVDLRELPKYDIYYTCLINGRYEEITVVKNKNWFTKLFPKFYKIEEVYNPYERYECKEFIIFLRDKDKKIQFKIGYDENNSEIYKKLVKADLVEKVEE